MEINLENNCEGFVDGFVLYFLCNVGFIREIWLGDCCGKFRGRNLNYEIFFLKLLKNYGFLELKGILEMI